MGPQSTQGLSLSLLERGDRRDVLVPVGARAADVARALAARELLLPDGTPLDSRAVLSDVVPPGQVLVLRGAPTHPGDPADPGDAADRAADAGRPSGATGPRTRAELRAGRAATRTGRGASGASAGWSPAAGSAGAVRDTRPGVARAGVAAVPEPTRSTLVAAWSAAALLATGVALRVLALVLPGDGGTGLAAGSAAPMPAVVGIGVAAVLAALVPAPGLPVGTDDAARPAHVVCAGVADAVTSAVWLLGALAGLLAADAAGVAGVSLPVTLGLVAACVVTAVRLARIRESTAQPLAGLLLAVTALLALAGVVALELREVYPAAVVLGALPVALRALPSWSFDVPDGVLLDPEPAQRTAMAVRVRPTVSPASVRRSTVERSVLDARSRARWSGLVLAVCGAALVVATALREPGDLWETLGTGLLLLAVLTAAALLPRGRRGGVERAALRSLAVLTLLVSGAWLLGRGVPGVWLAGGAATLAVVAIASGVGIGRGWRSVRWSRAADLVESLAVAWAPALGLLAGGVVAWMRLLASG
ncbi:MAG: hypothetical protein BGO96_10160 [Micrococcales bacterium 73-15]|uniref:hypothetical protein n=1 Tax=Salana multivorans TaxID=120377 RepID=UPI000962C5E3|nr:hypothetical protein [Salana multivorans]OJX93842.1 MAG: hypothetical protein BGO96_10160 [Micrococcales bacterium 73-15]